MIENFFWLTEWLTWWFNYASHYLSQNPDLFGIHQGRYIAAALLVLTVLLLLWLSLRWIWRVGGLYFLAIFTFKGRITRVVGHVDGDTIKVEPPQRGEEPVSIRMIGVDTPESRKSLYMDTAPFGKEASDYTRQRLPRWQKVILLYDKEKNDKFGRELAYVYLPNGEFYNASLLKAGYAWAAPYAPNLKYQTYFERLQAQAQKKNMPIWQVYDNKKELKSSYKKTHDYRAFKKKHEH